MTPSLASYFNISKTSTQAHRSRSHLETAFTARLEELAARTHNSTMNPESLTLASYRQVCVLVVVHKPEPTRSFISVRSSHKDRDGNEKEHDRVSTSWKLGTGRGKHALPSEADLADRHR